MVLTVRKLYFCTTISLNVRCSHHVLSGIELFAIWRCPAIAQYPAMASLCSYLMDCLIPEGRLCLQAWAPSHSVKREANQMPVLMRSLHKSTYLLAIQLLLSTAFILYPLSLLCGLVSLYPAQVILT